MRAPPRVRIGLAGWSNPPAHKALRAASQSHLTHYAAHFSCVEINSSFYRPHRPSTYLAWRTATPAAFRFSVKMPRSITHDAALEHTGAELNEFLSAVSALEQKLAVILVQLPPGFAFNARVVGDFFSAMRRKPGCEVVCEPRHASWFTGEADALLARVRVGRVAADPPRFPGAELPGGSAGFRYFRWHGSPQMYYSNYTTAQIERFALSIDSQAPTWCIFDNTAQHAAWDNALSLAAILAARSLPPSPTSH